MHVFLTLLLAALICGMGLGLAFGCRLPQRDARDRTASGSHPDEVV
jgi:hypothetical protein